MVVFALPANAENPKALYVTSDSVNLQDLTIYNELIQKGFTVTKSVDTIPENMEEYDLVIVNTYTAPWQGTADYMKNYIANGGGAVILGGVPAMFPYPYPHGYTTQGYYDISYISDWFGSSRYANTGGTARITMDNPLGTTYYSGDILIPNSGGPYAAAVTNLHPDDTQILARWDTGPVFAFTHTYGNGRVFYLAASGNPTIDELYLAGALWAANVPLNTPPIADSNGPYTADEGTPITFDASGSSDLDAGDSIVLYEWDLDNDGVFDDATGVNPIATWNDDYSGTITLRVTDSNGATDTDSTTVTVSNVAPTVESITIPPDTDSTTMTVSNVAPTVESITIPPDPVHVNTEISVEGTFSDPGIDDTHTTEWDWDDNTTSSGIVGTGTVLGSHIYDTPGLYKVTLTVTDDDSGIGTLVSTTYIVVYDPSGAFVTGGGWINSPEGAYPSDTTLTGKSSFGFVSKYKKGATIPTGQTEFHSKVADLIFHSSSYDWLVIANAKAICKGEGTINGEVRDNGEPYKFLLSSIDADINENDAHSDDKFRMKIYYEDNTGEVVVYDNLIYGTEDADQTTELQGGSIVIHKR